MGADRQCAAGSPLGGAADCDDRRCARRPVHRHRDFARPGAHGRALRRSPVDYTIKPYQTGVPIPVRAIVRHPQFDIASYAASRATADLALLKLAAPLPDVVVPATLAAPRRVAAGETLTIAGFGVTLAGTARGLGLPRMATLTVTGQPGSLQIRLYDIATRNQRIGLGGCTGDSGAPAFDGDGPMVIGVVTWSTAPGDEDGLRRPHRRHAAVALSRLDHQYRAQIQFSAGAVTAGYLIHSEDEGRRTDCDVRRVGAERPAIVLYPQVFHPSFAAASLANKSCQQILPTSPAQQVLPNQSKQEIHTVKRFVIEREMPAVGTLEREQMRAAAEKSNSVLRELGPDIQWMESHVTQDKIYCVYLAKDAALIRRHAEMSGFPANRISEVKRTIDPTTAAS